MILCDSAEAMRPVDLERVRRMFREEIARLRRRAESPAMWDRVEDLERRVEGVLSADRGEPRT